jgi:hypothetical protein
MRRSIRFPAFGAIAATALFLIPAVSAGAADPQVYRGGIAGSATENVVKSRSGVTEIRGVVGEAEPVEEVAAVATTEAPVVTAGSRLWFYDAEAGTVTVCRLGTRINVGADRITCETQPIDL